MLVMALRLEEIIESKRRIEQENPLWFWDLWAGFDWNVSAAHELWLQSKVGETIADPATGSFEKVGARYQISSNKHQSDDYLLSC
jgi:hypothetical protein